MKLLSKTTAVAAVATNAALFLLGTPAIAFSITRNSNASSLLSALLGTTTGLKNFSVATSGAGDAFGIFTDDPFGLGSGVVLSTGQVVALPGTNTEAGGLTPDYNHIPNDLSTNFGDNQSSEDSITLKIRFDADSTADKLFFQYVFGSEEFVEFGGSDYNDSFELLLNGINMAKLSDGQAVTINNLVPTPGGPYHRDYINNPAGSGTATKLDGYTKLLTFEGFLNKNAANTLTINIKDVADGQLDSAVFIKGGSLGTQLPPAKNIPEPNVVFGLLTVSGMAFLKALKRGKNRKV